MTKAASPSAAGSEVFVSRMFAPLCGVPEGSVRACYVPGWLTNFATDHVCGSAHCLLVPYWAQKRLDSSAASGSVTLETPMKVLQVSPRGGTLFVSWDTKERVVKIGGEVAVWGRGEVFI
jgi:predicted PhzF superfamily epimerase YddE/YHI9